MATYTQALLALTVRDADGVARAPDAVLAHYSDGWRLIAQFSELGPKVRATSYTIDPIEAIKNIDDAMKAETDLPHGIVGMFARDQLVRLDDR